MPERLLYLIRHGQYDTTTRSPDGGSLTGLGEEQARLTGEALKHLPFEALYTSTMVRARETASFIGKAITLTPQPNDVLREAIPTVAPRIADSLMDMMTRNPNLTHESIHKDRKRADQAFDRYFTRRMMATPAKSSSPTATSFAISSVERLTLT